MIVAREPGGLCVVLQVDHQDQCRHAADAWGNDDFERLDPWEPVQVAAALHDEGWRAWEALPRIDGAGGPMDFPDVPRPEHVALYEQGIAAAEAHGPAVGLLVSMHGLGLYRARLGLDGVAPDPALLTPVVQEFICAQEVRQARLWAALGDTPDRRAWAWAAYRLLQAWDGLSLFLTWRGLPQAVDRRLRSVPRAAGDPGVDLALRPVDHLSAICAPFPFRGGEAVVPVTARVIPDRVYTSDEDLRTTLARAAPERRPFRILPDDG